MAFLRKFLILIFFVAVLAAAAISFELTAGLTSGWLTEPFLIEKLGENYKFSVFLILVLSSILLAILTFFGEKWLSKDLADGKKSTQPTTKTFEPEIRDWLRTRYQNRLDQKLAGRLPINLRRIDFTETAAQLSQKQFKEIAPEAIEAELTEFFKTAEGRLLIVGAPGAGKTTLLLQLAVALLDSQPDALPAVVNLATWTSEFKTIEDWLKKVLPVELGASTKLAADLLAESRVILLFDGLDEIADAEQRTACLAAIDLFASTARPRREFAISSRKKEFLEAARVPTAFPIEVGLLKMEQIERELTRRDPAEPEDRDLLSALKNDKLLREAAETPFYFNCLQLLFGENKRPVFSADDRAGREMEILDAFVENELGKCEKGETENWLAFLGSRMNQRDLVRFELRDLQYDFWKKWGKLSLILGRLIESGVFAFILFIFFAIAFDLLNGLKMWLVLSIFQTSINGIFGLQIKIETKDSRVVRHSDFFKEWQKYKPILLTFGLIGIISGWVIGEFTGVLFFGTFLFVMVLWILFVQDMHSSFTQISTPYQRFTASAKNLHFSILQHLLLRWQLSKKGLLPLRLVDFLNEMASHHIKTRRFTTSPVHLFESDGASWRFRHRLIQEWFAARWVEPKDQTL